MIHRAAVVPRLLCGIALCTAAAPPPCQAEGSQPADPLREARALLQSQRTRPDAARFAAARSLIEGLTQRTPGDAEAWTLLAWARLTDHRFSEALEAAGTAERLRPDRPETLALMTDALVELGRYAEAIETAQRLLDLDPGVPAWTRAARLRFLHGDLEGALGLLQQAAASAGPRGEATAWVWVELARAQLQAGATDAAQASVERAALAFPRHPRLAATRAEVLAARGDKAGALGQYQEAIAAQPNAEDALAAWRLARELGRSGEARHLGALLDGLTLLDRGGLSRRALAEYLTETDRPGPALELARAELAARPDLYSQATLARVLARAGRSHEAQDAARLALALGTPDRRLRRDMEAILTLPASQGPPP